MWLGLIIPFVIAPATVANPIESLERRAPYAGGGWAILNGNGACPAGTTAFNAGVNFGAGPNLCCPNGFKPQGSGDVSGIACCPSGEETVANYIYE
jgi:hypothetical protein